MKPTLAIGGKRSIRGVEWQRQQSAKAGRSPPDTECKKTAVQCRCRMNRKKNSVDELPRFRAIELSNLNSVDLLRLKVARIDAEFRARRGVDRLPMCRATTNFATHRADCAGSPYVLRRILRMPAEVDGVGFVQRPKCSVTSANRAITVNQVFRL